MVVDLKNYLERILVELGAATIKHREKVSGFLLDNEWFGVSINLDDYTISEKDAEVLKNHIKNYLTTLELRVWKESFQKNFLLQVNYSYNLLKKKS